MENVSYDKRRLYSFGNGVHGAKAMKFKLAYQLEMGDRLRPLVIVVGVSIIGRSCFVHRCAKKIELVYLGFGSSFMTNRIFVPTKFVIT